MRARLVERGIAAELPGGVAGAAGERRGLLLALEDDDGRLGLGEASPLPGYSPDAFDDVHAALADRVSGRWPSPGDDPLAVARRLGQGLEALPAARFALETALLSLAAARRDRPLAALLGPARESVALAALLEATEVEAAVAEAWAATARGVATLKLKLATPAGLEADLERAEAVRRAVGPGVRLRFDANRRLEPGSLAATLDRLAALDAELVEEPLPPAELLAVASRLAGRSPRLGLDESLQRAPDRELGWRLVERGVALALVLKPACLGLLGALELATMAEEAGVAVFVTHLFDGPVALAAAAQLALALPGEVLACGLDRHRGLDAWPPATIASLRRDRVVSSSEPGLGLGGILA